MDPVHLYSRQGAFITTMYIPFLHARPDVLTWGSRCFVKQANGSYHEGTSIALKAPVPPATEGASAHA